MTNRYRQTCIDRSDTTILRGILAVFLLAQSACAVLTDSQVKEVGNFSKLSASYVDVPAGLAKDYGVLLRDNKLLVVSRLHFGGSQSSLTQPAGAVDNTEAMRGWNTIKEAYDLEADFGGLGKRLDTALDTLRLYAQVLDMCVSDKANSELSSSAQKFGSSLDKAAKVYSDQFRPDSPLPAVGENIAKAIRATTGVFTSSKRASILRVLVHEADPFVQAVAGEIEQIAGELLKPSLVNYEQNYLAPGFWAVANAQGRLGYSDISAIYADYAHVRSSLAVADRVVELSRLYRQAHARLVKETETRLELDYGIEEIKSLQKELSAASKVGNKKNAE